jgi:hypothetical protein
MDIEGFKGKNQRAADEKNHLNMGIIHHEGLYDLDEDMSGEKYNLADGKPINNSTEDPGKPELIEVEPHESSEDALPPLPEEEDEATEWLKKNQPN